MIGFHRDLNRETAASWDRFREHRQRVSHLLADVAGDPPSPEAGTLAILGAGNGNDLDLPAIVPRYRQVHLFDIDREAITRARDRQPPAIAERLILHAPIDLGGALADLGKLRHRPASADELGALPGAGLRQVLPRVAERFDVVASTCLVSQLVHSCQRLLGDAHPHIQPIACAVVVAHLRLLVELIRPGGTGLLVTDTVSSDTYPLAELWGTRAPWALVDELEATGNHLSGTTPSFMRRILNTDPVISPRVSNTCLEEPWLWTLSDAETYLVYALRFERRV
jgi:hypothetical protein